MSGTEAHAHPWPFSCMPGHLFGRFRPPRPPHPPMPPPWFMAMMGKHPRRAERGDVRYLILDAIRDTPRHGYDIIQTIEANTDGAYRPSPGTVYPTLQMLEEMGFVTSKKEGGRRLYSITEEGLAELQAHQDEVDDAYERLGSDVDWNDLPDFHILFKRFRRLMRTLGGAFFKGRLSAETLAQIADVLDDAISRIDKLVKGKRAK